MRLWEKICISGSPAFRFAAQLPVASKENAYVYGECTSGARYLNTPRLIQDQAGTTVWRNDNTEPFGDSVPNDNPSGLGAFEFPLRFPGQYFDRETNLSYNYFRDYDPTIGRYVESDPIGLKGGLNTYAYALSNPVAKTDAFGLSTLHPTLTPKYDCSSVLLNKPDCVLRGDDAVFTFGHGWTPDGCRAVCFVKCKGPCGRWHYFEVDVPCVLVVRM